MFGTLYPQVSWIGQFSARSKACSSARGSFFRTLAAFLSETEKPCVDARPSVRLRFLGKSMDCPPFSALSAAVLVFLDGRPPFETVGIPSHGTSLLLSASHRKNSRIRPSLLDSVRYFVMRGWLVQSFPPFSPSQGFQVTLSIIRSSCIHLSIVPPRTFS